MRQRCLYSWRLTWTQLINDEISEEYIPQKATNMLCTGRESRWFLSNIPKDPIDDERLMLPDDLRLFAKQVTVDELTYKQFDGSILKGAEVFREIEEAATATIEEAAALLQEVVEQDAGECVKFAYADPPYIGQAKRHYSHDPNCAEVDHAELIAQLCSEFPDGWALSASKGGT